MLSDEETRFMHSWEEAMLNRKSLQYRKMLPGFLWGFVLGCASILPPFAVMERRPLGISGGTLVLFLVSVLGIAIFVGYLRWRMFLDKNEGLYLQLKHKQDCAAPEQSSNL